MVPSEITLHKRQTTTMHGYQTERSFPEIEMRTNLLYVIQTNNTSNSPIFIEDLLTDSFYWSVSIGTPKNIGRVFV